ncbi:MAG: acetyltransferase-like isoleucine patch superfamily enzyme [Gammaproteobacteria bacterium]|jgi:acetyltransferase-like isoleucine patch superfamily enzyme
MGAYCSVSRNVQIGLANHPMDWLSTHTFQYSSSLFSGISEFDGVQRKRRHLHHPKTLIGADVWIGANAAIRSGVKIGHGAIIAAGAVVVKDVEPYEVVGGVSAKHIKYRFSPEIIEQLLEIKWWLLPLKKIQDVDFSDINKAIEEIKYLKKTN